MNNPSGDKKKPPRDKGQAQAAGGVQKKKRAQPGDFERQVNRMRRDINAIRDNLAAAEKSLSAPHLNPPPPRTPPPPPLPIEDDDEMIYPGPAPTR